jgi:hypothetical protein
MRECEEDMKAISIRQPWAWAILYAGKDVENRSWAHDYRGPVFIHASKKFDHEGWKWLEDNQSELFPSVELPSPSEFLTGGIVGQAVIKKLVRSRHFSPWMFGPWGWVLIEPKPLDFFPCKGQLGLFEIKLPA